MSGFSFVPKKDFNRAVETTFNEFRTAYAAALKKQGKKNIIRKCEAGVHEVVTQLLHRSNKWLLPYIPERLFIRQVSKGIWFHVYSDKYSHRFENTIMGEKDTFLREVRFKLKGTRSL